MRPTAQPLRKFSHKYGAKIPTEFFYYARRPRSRNDLRNYPQICFHGARFALIPRWIQN